jgi:phosphatidylserine/phosphatidylglycerophosphate/cardiolipin synthase-like enzyme
MASSRGKRTLTLGGLITMLVLAAIFYFFGNSPTAPSTPTVIIPPTIVPTVQTVPTVGGGTTESGLPSWLQIYFTNPNPPDNTSNGIDQVVVPVITQAAQTIDVTSFDLNLPSVVDALVAASQRGIRVRVVVDQENGEQTLAASKSPTGAEYDAVQVLKNAGIPVVNGGRTSGLMHDKMVIVDSRIVLTGSLNLSYNDIFRNNNNLLVIANPTLIANYQAKFNELFVDQRFGTHAVVGALTQQMAIGGVQVENYFSPVDHVMDKLIAYVQGAQKSIRFMAFTYTDTNLAAAMIERYQSGVAVKGVIENRNASNGALIPLFCANVPVQVDGNKYTMHHKVIIIDESIVITGSFNFTKSADDENDDNVIVIHSPALAQLYLQEFERVNSIAQPPDGISCTK